MFSNSLARGVSSVAASLIFSAGLAYAQEPVAPLPPPSQPAQSAQPGKPFTITGQVRRAGTLKPVGQGDGDRRGDGDRGDVRRRGAVHAGQRAAGKPARDHRGSRSDAAAGRAHVERRRRGAARCASSTPSCTTREVVSVSPEAREQFESYQPTSVLAGQDLDRELEASLGATLRDAAGRGGAVASGPGPSRPVIRGLDGDRVLILEDGQRMGDLSSQSGDHGVTVNPAAAAQDRGGARSGDAALRRQRHRRPGQRHHRTTSRRSRSTARTATVDARPRHGGARRRRRRGRAVRATAAGRCMPAAAARAIGDVDTPEGEVENSQSRSGFGNVGLSWTGRQGLRRRQLRLRRHAVRHPGRRGGTDPADAAAPRVRAARRRRGPRAARSTRSRRRWRAALPARRARGRRGRHAFDERHDRARTCSARHRAVGRLTGTVGGCGHATATSRPIGEEALSPPVDQNGRRGVPLRRADVAARHVPVRRPRRSRDVTSPRAGCRARTSPNVSGSVGLLFRPAAADDTLTIARQPGARGAQPGARGAVFLRPASRATSRSRSAIPDLESEHALGFDAVAALAHRARRRARSRYFRNDIDDFIFRNPISAEEFESANSGRSFDARRRVPVHRVRRRRQRAAGHRGARRRPSCRERLRRARSWTTCAATLQGQRRAAAAHSAAPRQRRAALSAQRVPGRRRSRRPRRSRTACSARRRRPTATRLLKLFALVLVRQPGGVTSTITARLDNATNELYRNHLSLIKDFVPEMGRNFKLVYAVRF